MQFSHIFPRHPRAGVLLRHAVLFGAILLAACGVTPPLARPALVRDINPTSASVATNPSDFAVLDDVVYFLADDAIGKRVLWRSDGTTSGTGVVTTLPTGEVVNGVFGLRRVGTQLFFFAATGPASAYELWRSDGTAAGTRAIAPLGFGADAFFMEDEQPQLAAAGETALFISAANPDGLTLSRSDGTSTGTTSIRLFPPLDTQPVQIAAFTSVGNQIFFTAEHSPEGENALWNALWRSDGMPEGTYLIYEHEVGYMAAAGSRLFFFGDDLMVTDGSKESPRTLKRVDGQTSLTTIGSQLYFTDDTELWTSDGTVEGTTLVRRFDAGVQEILALASASNRVFLTTRSADDGPLALWVSDGTDTGTIEIASFQTDASSPPFGFAAVGDMVYFVASDVSSGAELWCTDGTEQGTRLVRDIEPGASNGLPQIQYGRLLFGDSSMPADMFELLPFGDQLLFGASDNQDGLTLWRSDGTEAGTTLLVQGSPGSASSTPMYLGAIGERLLFFANDGAHGMELWTSNGSPETTVLVADVNPGPSGSMFHVLTTILFQREPAIVGDKLYFTAVASDTLGLWASDGTASGTVALPPDDIYRTLAAALMKTSDETRAFGMVHAASTVYFYGPSDDGSELRLWRSDGTVNGTTRVADVSIGTSTSMLWGTPAPPVSIGGKLLFRAYDETHGSELWSSDGTAAGTRLVKDIEPGIGDSSPFALTVAGNQVFFLARTKATGLELWISDGSEQGTQLVKEVNVGPERVPSEPTASGPPDESFCRIDLLRLDRTLVARDDSVFFMGSDGEHGCELWVSDGTAPGTRMVVDSNPGSGDASQIWRGAFFVAPMVIGPNNRVYFAAEDSAHGLELWVSDGTASGTTMLADIDRGAASAYPAGFTVIENRVYFAADDGIHGRELWVTDGTTAGTALVVDVYQGAGSGDPAQFTVAGSRLYFIADDGVHGHELWSLPFNNQQP